MYTQSQNQRLARSSLPTANLTAEMETVLLPSLRTRLKCILSHRLYCTLVSQRGPPIHRLSHNYQTNSSFRLHVCSAVNKNRNWCYNTHVNVPKGQWTQVEISQKQEENDLYRSVFISYLISYLGISFRYRYRYHLKPEFLALWIY